MGTLNVVADEQRGIPLFHTTRGVHLAPTTHTTPPLASSSFSNRVIPRRFSRHQITQHLDIGSILLLKPGRVRLRHRTHTTQTTTVAAIRSGSVQWTRKTMSVSRSHRSDPPREVQVGVVMTERFDRRAVLCVVAVRAGETDRPACDPQATDVEGARTRRVGTMDGGADGQGADVTQSVLRRQILVSTFRLA